MPSKRAATTTAPSRHARQAGRYYPKKDYWIAYLAQLPRKPGFADRFALDVMRLKLATGT